MVLRPCNNRSDLFLPTTIQFRPYWHRAAQPPCFPGLHPRSDLGRAVSDWSILFFAKRIKSIYEPEMRLWLAIFPVFVGPAGLFLCGYSLAAVSTVSLHSSIMLTIYRRACTGSFPVLVSPFSDSHSRLSVTRLYHTSPTATGKFSVTPLSL
jgi:hypothetical protein